jgi:hypothetical protein
MSLDLQTGRLQMFGSASESSKEETPENTGGRGWIG